MMTKEIDVDRMDEIVGGSDKAGRESISRSIGSSPAADYTHRSLKPRHIQLIGIGGTIGTALFVQIGKGLIQGGPGSLFIAFTIWCFFVLCITVSLAEMVCWNPISSPFIRFAGRYVDEAFGVATGWNFFIFQAAMVPFEMIACNVVIKYWDVDDRMPVGGTIAIVMLLYALANMVGVKWFGEIEFWSALGKMLLIIGLIVFTFVAMVGGNPLHDAFGFRYWKTPGAFAEHYKTGSLGRFLGFLQCLIQASFTIAGPDYVAITAGEAVNPRRILPMAFRSVFYRLTSFFMLGSLAVGILVPYNDPTLKAAYEESKPGAAASPYVVAMGRLNIPILPHIVNAMVLLAAFSAGNSYVFCSSRCLYGLALEGNAPRFLTRCLKNGVPIYAVGVVMLISLLAFLQLSESSAVVLQWFVNLMTASQLINFSVICYTYTRFYKACMAQHVDRSKLPFVGWWQPYPAWMGLIAAATMALVGGYNVFLPGNWSVTTFLFSYLMIFIFPIVYLVWKLLKKTKMPAPADIQLLTNMADIEEYEKTYVPAVPRNKAHKMLNKLFE